MQEGDKGVSKGGTAQVSSGTIASIVVTTTTTTTNYRYVPPPPLHGAGSGGCTKLIFREARSAGQRAGGGAGPGRNLVSGVYHFYKNGVPSEVGWYWIPSFFERNNNMGYLPTWGGKYNLWNKQGDIPSKEHVYFTYKNGKKYMTVFWHGGLWSSFRRVKAFGVAGKYLDGTSIEKDVYACN